jgi:hypothetical protein
MSKTAKPLTYSQIRAEAEKPLDERKNLPIGRNGAKVAPRKFHLNRAEIDQLSAALRDGDKMPNPHNKGAYFYSIETLKALGLDRRHSLPVFTAKMRELMSDKSTVQDVDGKPQTAWQRFINKESRNEETGLDKDGRIIQNLEVLQRVNVNRTTPYGLKLLQVGQKVLKSKGCVIDITLGGEGGKEIMVALNTDSDTPVNERKRPRKTVAAGPAKAAKPRKASKPRKPKAAKAPKAETPAAETKVEAQTDTAPSATTAEAKSE